MLEKPTITEPLIFIENSFPQLRTKNALIRELKGNSPYLTLTSPNPTNTEIKQTISKLNEIILSLNKQNPTPPTPAGILGNVIALTQPFPYDLIPTFLAHGFNRYSFRIIGISPKGQQKLQEKWSHTQMHQKQEIIAGSGPTLETCHINKQPDDPTFSTQIYIPRPTLSNLPAISKYLKKGRQQTKLTSCTLTNDDLLYECLTFKT